jgi:anti-anti-sigma factor
MSEKSTLLLERRRGRLSGEIDIAVTRVGEIDLLAYAMSKPDSTVVIDCEDMTFIDSAGVRMLEHVAQRSGKRVTLANVHPGQERLFEMLGLRETFGIDTSRANGSTHP